MRKRSPFVKGLIDRYLAAVTEEQTRIEAYERTSRELADTRETKKLCAALLKKEGVDLSSLGPAGDKASGAAMASLSVSVAAPSSSNGSSGPLSATHAVYMVLRSVDNAPLSADNISFLSTDQGMRLTVQEVNKVIWTQLKKGRMRKNEEDGTVQLTPQGETFNSFRKQNIEEIPVISNASA